MKFKATIRHSTLSLWTKSAMNAVLRHEYHKIGKWWHRVARPRHFTRGAFQRYGYTPRSRGYTARKRRKFGHTQPLVLTGETRDLSQQHRIQSTAKGVTVIYAGLRKLNFTPRGGKIKMRAEFETISQSEEQHMTAMMTNAIERKLQTAARNGGRLRLVRS